MLLGVCSLKAFPSLSILFESDSISVIYLSLLIPHRDEMYCRKQLDSTDRKCLLGLFVVTIIVASRSIYLNIISSSTSTHSETSNSSRAHSSSNLLLLPIIYSVARFTYLETFRRIISDDHPHDNSSK